MCGVTPASARDSIAAHRTYAFHAFLLCFYGAWLLRVVLLLPVDARIEPMWLRQCWSQGLRVLIWVIPVIAYLKYVDRVPAVSFLRLGALPRGRRLALGIAITVGFLALTTASGCWLQGAHLSSLKKWSGEQWALTLASMSFVAFAEEVLFRGFVFQKLRGWHSFPKASLMAAVLFLLIHWPGWLYVHGLTSELASLSVGVVVIALVLGWLLEATESLWPCIILHLLNNVWSGLLL